MKDKEEKVRTFFGRREKKRRSRRKNIKGRSPGWVSHGSLGDTTLLLSLFRFPHTNYTPFSPRNSIKSNVSTKLKRERKKSVALRLDMAVQPLEAIHTRKSCTSRQFLTRWPFRHVCVCVWFWFYRIYVLCKESKTGKAQSLLLCHEAQSKQINMAVKLNIRVI